MAGDKMIRGTRCIPSENLYAFLIEKYSIDPSSTFTDLGGGNNLNLLVFRNGAPAVARIYRPWVTASRLSDTNNVLARLLADGLPVPQKLPTVDGGVALLLRWQARRVRKIRSIRFSDEHLASCR